MSHASSAIQPQRGLIPMISLRPSLDAFKRMARYRRDMLGSMQSMYETHGPVVMMRVGRMRQVHLFGPEANKTVMLDRDGVLSAKRAWDMIMGRIFTNGLLLRDGDDHLYHRRIMQAAFTQSALRSYVDAMNPRIASAIADWPTNGSPLMAYKAYKLLALDLAWSVFLGVELGEDAQPINRAFEAAVAASMSVVRLAIPGLEFNRGLKGRKRIMEYFERLMPKKRATSTPDLFSRICHAESEQGERYSDKEIIDHLIFLMMAAHDTTTSTLCSLTYELAKHPEWQERARAESMAFDTDFLGFDDQMRLTSLNLALMETLRRYPPLSTVPRVSTAPFEFGGYRIPASSMVTCFPIHTHHMSEYWREPFSFDPERFAEPRNEHKQHSHLFVPFGSGAHACIGLRFAEMQIRAVMHQLLRRYRFKVAEGYRMPVQQAPISKPLDGLPLWLEPVGNRAG